MLALLEAREIPRPGKLQILKEYFNPDVEYEIENSLGFSALRVQLGYYNGMSKKAIQRALSNIVLNLQRAGVTQLITSKKFPGKSFIYNSFKKMDSKYLYEYLAGDIAVFAAGENGGTAAFFCHSVGEREQRALMQICSVYRHIVLVTDRDAGIVCKNIRRRYGIAVMGAPTAKQLNTADFAIFFNVPREKAVLKESCVAFSPDPEVLRNINAKRIVSAVQLALPGDMRAKIPEGFEPSPIISAAAQWGACDLRKIKVADLHLDNL